MQGSGTFTLTARGSGFSSSSQIVFNGSAKSTTFVSSTQLTAQISTGDISSPGSFSVKVQDGASVTGSVSFFVVPGIGPKSVQVVAGSSPTTGINIAVQALNPPTLSLIAVGVGTKAGVTGVTIAPGNSANLLIVGEGVIPGTFYLVTGNTADVTVKQPLVSAFTQTTDGLPAVTVSVSVNSSAALGARSIVVTNPAGEISIFPGGLLVSQ